MAIPMDDWLKSLDEMEVTLASTLASLDQHERKCGSIRADQPISREPPGVPSIAQSHLSRMEARLGEWDTRLSAAAELAASVERELNDRQATIERWQELFNGWCGLLEQHAKPA